MACKDCFDNCGNSVVADACVKYTGPDIDFLGIEQGDQLSQLEAALVAKLQVVLDGTGITLSGLTSCASIDAAIGTKDKTLVNILQALYTVVCALKSDVTTIQSTIAVPSSFNTECLTGLPTTPTRDDILQAILVLLCSINTSVSTITSNYVTTDTVCDLVASCLSSSGTVQENTKMPKYCAIPYVGPLNVFDSEGNGISSFGYDKVYLCVGQTVRGFVLPDTRGRVPVGANTGVPGGAMDSAVDPALSANAGYSISKGTKKGEFTHTNTLQESAPHTHGVTDPGHSHTVGFGTDKTSGNKFANFAKLDNTNVTKTSSVNPTGVTINSAGGGQPHNNVQPSFGTYFIIYIP